MADQNTSRVKDIHREVEKQIITLREQAEKAREYKNNRELLESTEKCYLVGKWEQIHRRHEELSKSISIRKTEEKSLLELCEEQKNSLGKLKDSAGEVEKTFREKRETLVAKRGHKELQIREKTSQQERIKEA